MADVARNRSSHSKNNRGRGKYKHKERKKDSPRKKHGFDNARSTRDSTSKKYDRKFEDQNTHHSSRQWDERPVSHKTINETIYSKPQWDHYKDESLLNNNAMLNGQQQFGDHFNISMSDESRFNSYDNRNGEIVTSLYAKIEDLKKQVEFFYQENDKLKYQLYNGSNLVHEASSLDVNITFRDKNLEKKFLPVLQELACEVIHENIRVEDLETFLTTKRNSAEDNIPEGELFALDNSTSGNEHVPCYEASFQEVLQDPDLMNEIDAKKDKPRFKTCFNCSEDHKLQECPYPMDYKKIAMARKQRSREFVPQVRYHVQGEQEKDLKPGVISDKLREALDLDPDRIPSFVYHMRVLDYPPGWLEEATVETSGIALYGTDVNSGDNPESNQQSMGSQVQYDPDKLIDFPGFNVPLPPNFIDDSEYLGMPPLQDCHLRSVFEQYLPKVEPLKRKRKLPLHDQQPIKIQRLEEDMEVEDVLELNPPLPEENPPLPPPEDEPLPPPPPDDSLPPLPEEESLPPLPEEESLPPLPEEESLPPLPEEESLPPLPEYSPDSPTEDLEVFEITEEQEFPVTDEQEFHDTNEQEVTDISESQTEEQRSREIKFYNCDSPTEEIFEIVDYESDSGTETPMSASIMEGLVPVLERYKLKNDSNKETTPSLKDLEELKKRLVMELGISGDCSSDGSAVTPCNNSESQENSHAGSVSSLVSETASSSKRISMAELCFGQEDSNNVSACSLISETPSASRQVSMTESCLETPVTSRQASATESCSETSLCLAQISKTDHENGSFKTPSPSRQVSSMVVQGGSSEEAVSLSQLSRTASGSKLVSLGTPSLSRHSSFHKLPSYDNFSKDVTTHLNFENLPNSVGTYQKMKKVIKKVKEKINSFMQ